MSSKQQLKLKHQKRSVDKARRQYDERLTLMNEHIRNLMKNKLGDITPVCPACKAYDVKSLSPRRGILVGVKPCYKCKACGRTFVIDNDSFRNVWLKLMALRAITFGGPSMASHAGKMLYDYGINAEYSPDYAYVRGIAKNR